MDRKAKREIEKKQQNIDRARRLIRHEREERTAMEGKLNSMNRLLHMIIKRIGPQEIEFTEWRDEPDGIITKVDAELVRQNKVILMTEEQLRSEAKTE